MHELSIAYSIVEASSAAAKEAGAEQVDAVLLKVGLLSGVVQHALHFSWEIATEGTILAGSRLEIEELAVIVHCPSCVKDVELPTTNRFRCPICDTRTPKLVQGKELEIVSLQIPEVEPV